MIVVKVYSSGVLEVMATVDVLYTAIGSAVETPLERGINDGLVAVEW